MKSQRSLLTTILVFALLSSSLVHGQQNPAAIVPAEKLPEGWDEIDERLLFLMVRLANVEASLDAIEKAIGSSTRKKAAKTGEGKRAEAGNDRMDRKGGGPMKWSEFYGTTAESFFYHPTDRNSTYYTTTVLNQRGPQADNKVGGGVPAGQGVPVHQRPPQFDYIYRANENAKERAETEAAELKGKIEELAERRHRLEIEQSGLWCEVAFRAVSHYDLDKKPLYRFEPIVGDDTESRLHADSMKAAAVFMALALSIVDAAQKDQATTFSKIKPAVSDARQRLNDGWLELGIDTTDRYTTEGRFAALAKRLDDVASNLSDSYVVANEGDQAHDQQRKDTFRAMLQQSLVSYAQIILALDEMSTVMKNDWKIKPDVKKPIQFVSLTDVVGVQMRSVDPLPPVDISSKKDNRTTTPAVKRPLRKTPDAKPNWGQFTFKGAALGGGVVRVAKLSDEQKRNGDWRKSGDFNEIRTKDSYIGGVDITVVARTEKNNIRITGPRHSLVIFNWELNNSELGVTRPSDSKPGDSNFSKATTTAEPLVPGEWYTLRFRVANDGLDVSVNGNLVFTEKGHYDLSTKSTVAVWSWDSDLE